MMSSSLLLHLFRAFLSYNLLFAISSASASSSSSWTTHHPSSIAIKHDNNNNNNEIQLGTTIVALRTKQGVIVGADTRTSQGSMVSNRHADKLSILYQNGPVTCVLCRSGSAADTQFLAEQARWEFRSRALLQQRQQHPSLNEIARWLRYVVMNGDYSASLLCAGYDPQEEGGGGGGRILSISKTGALLEEGLYAAAGSGSIHIMGLMDSKMIELQQQLMDEEEAIQFVSYLIQRAMARDHASGGTTRIIVMNDKGCQSLTIVDDDPDSSSCTSKKKKMGSAAQHDLKGFQPAAKIHQRMSSSTQQQ